MPSETMVAFKRLSDKQTMETTIMWRRMGMASLPAQAPWVPVD